MFSNFFKLPAEKSKNVEAIEKISEPVISYSLHTSIQTGNVKDVIYCINNGSDLEELDSNGYTPLNLALWIEHSDAIFHLIQNGAIISEDASNDNHKIKRYLNAGRLADSVYNCNKLHIHQPLDKTLEDFFFKRLNTFIFKKAVPARDVEIFKKIKENLEKDHKNDFSYSLLNKISTLIDTAEKITMEDLIIRENYSDEVVEFLEDVFSISPAGSNEPC